MTNTVTIRPGGTTYEGPEAMELMRRITLLNGMEFERTSGMRFGPGPSCFMIARRDYACHGKREVAIKMMRALVDAQRNKVEVIHGT